MTPEAKKNAISRGDTALGIEMGSTRIKAVLIGPDHTPIAAGEYAWENRLEAGVWTYPLEEVWTGIREAYQKVAKEVESAFGEKLKTLGALGFSGMMHGYLPFDFEGNQLAEFRTWRNTITEKEAAELTELFSFNIPQRWSVAHLYRAICNGEKHTENLGFLTTLAGYVHWKVTGEKVLGVGEASGMFPIDSATGDYDEGMIQALQNKLKTMGKTLDLRGILPKVLSAGEPAGVLTAEGAKLLDPTGTLEPGALVCPPEGDAGTGMAATNSVSVGTGNVSAGTSIFAMAVLEKPLKRVHPEIDMVTTPDGKPVAMVHCNTCTSDLDAWVNLFGEVLESAHAGLTKGELYQLAYRKALEGDPDCGGIINCNYYSGEPVTGLEDGRPFIARMPDSPLSFGNFMRAQLYAAMATLEIGMEILFKEEGVELKKLYGHGGFFKTRGVGQRLMAGALNVPVAVMETAGEGGPWGMALLAMYRREKAQGESLGDYLEKKVFSGAQGECALPEKADAEGFARYMEGYRRGLEIEKAAVKAMKD